MENGVEVIDAETGAKMAALDCAARTLAWSPVDDSLAVGCADGVLRLWQDGSWAAAAFELKRR